MQTAVHFGAGNIGRGFLGQLYCEAGFKTIFVDVNPVLVQALREQQTYTITIADEPPGTFRVENVTAIDGTELAQVGEVLADAHIVSTAVGVNALPHVVPALAEGIRRRAEKRDAGPMNIIIAENLKNAGAWLRPRLEEALEPVYLDYLRERVGLVEASVGRMVPVVAPKDSGCDALAVAVEAYCELPVNGEAFVGPVPEIPHLRPLPNFEAYVARKLYVHNLSHAAAAYLGALRGYAYIWEAVGDAAVRAAVEAAAMESCEALSRKYGLPREDLDAHTADLLRRYENKALGDQVERVARDPIRKLARDDRLIGAMRLCNEQGVKPEGIALAAAAAIRYDHAEDSSAARVQSVRAELGLAGVVGQVCGLETDSLEFRQIAAADARLAREGWTT